MTREIFDQPALTKRAAVIARLSLDELDRIDASFGTASLQSSSANETVSVDVPLEAVPMMRAILAALADGQGLLIAPELAELTTAQAAELLNVSRPFVIKLIENGSIPNRGVRTHRRIRMQDLAAFKTESERDQRAALVELIADAQAESLGY